MIMLIYVKGKCDGNDEEDVERFGDGEADEEDAHDAKGLLLIQLVQNK